MAFEDNCEAVPFSPLSVPSHLHTPGTPLPPFSCASLIGLCTSHPLFFLLSGGPQLTLPALGIRTHKPPLLEACGLLQGAPTVWHTHPPACEETQTLHASRWTLLERTPEHFSLMLSPLLPNLGSGEHELTTLHGLVGRYQKPSEDQLNQLPERLPLMSSFWSNSVSHLGSTSIQSLSQF